ncbi:MAG: hypothetical protein JWM38_828 [Sphingomonas bacterium]|nr:hypothetical protein [Sphingomonas bacterium]MDB5717401.1 hypothetical protein [Sphingomonas bacterium]
MDGLLPALLAVALAEVGDKTQLLAILLAVRFGRPAPILAGIAVAALANSLIAAIGGALVAGMVPFRAITLMLAVALLSAGAGSLMRQKPPKVGIYDRLGPFAASAVAFFILEFGDKSQFLTFAVAARAQVPMLAAAGATIGILLASVPAVMLGDALPRTVPIRVIRVGIGILFVVIGVIVGLGALRLL